MIFIEFYVDVNLLLLVVRRKNEHMNDDKLKPKEIRLRQYMIEMITAKIITLMAISLILSL